MPLIPAGESCRRNGKCEAKKTPDGCGLVSRASPDAKKPNPGGGEHVVNESVSRSPFWSVVRAVVEFDGQHDVRTTRVAKHKIEVLLRDFSAVSSNPISGRARNDIGESHLTHDEPAARYRVAKHAVEGRLPSAQQRLLATVRQCSAFGRASRSCPVRSEASLRSGTIVGWEHSRFYHSDGRYSIEAGGQAPTVGYFRNFERATARSSSSEFTGWFASWV